MQEYFMDVKLRYLKGISNIQYPIAIQLNTASRCILWEAPSILFTIFILCTHIWDSSVHTRMHYILWNIWDAELNTLICTVVYIWPIMSTQCNKCIPFRCKLGIWTDFAQLRGYGLRVDSRLTQYVVIYIAICVAGTSVPQRFEFRSRRYFILEHGVWQRAEFTWRLL